MDSELKFTLLKATKADISAISILLKNANLPPDDLESWIDYFFVLTVNGKIEGSIGLEQWESVGLLRSFVISEGYRSKGLGVELFDRLMSFAKELKLNSILLLAKGASKFFEKNGFLFINRNKVPNIVKNSIQFQLDECSDYNVMKLDLN